MKEELSISELRRKKRSPHGPSGDPTGDAGTHPNGNGDHHAEEETWARTVAEEEPRPEPRRRSRPMLAAPPRRPADEEEALNLPFDVVRLLDALKRNWFLIVLAGLIFGSLGLSWLHFGQRAQVQLQLARRETPSLFRNNDEERGGSFEPQEFTDQALVNMVQGSDVLRRLSNKLGQKKTIPELAMSLALFPDRESESVTVAFKGRGDAKEAVQILNTFADEIVQYTKEVQVQEAKAFHTFITHKLESVNHEMAALADELKDAPADSRVIASDEQTKSLLTQLTDLETKYEMLKIDLEANNPIQDKLRATRDELATLLQKYTDAHPTVQRKKDELKDLEAQLERSRTTGVVPPSTADIKADNVHMLSASSQKQSLSKQAEQTKLLIDRLKAKLSSVTGGKSVEDALRHNRFSALGKIRSALAERQRQAELFQDNPPGYLHVVSPASLDRVMTRAHVKKSFVLAFFGAFFGIFCVGGFVAAREVLDDRIKSIADLERATDLPLIGTLGDLSKMNEAEQKAWAFRTWTIMKGKLSGSQNKGFVCGLISAHHNEGRSTWVKLLVSTATDRGLRVLRISTKPSGEPAIHPHESMTEEQKREAALALEKGDLPNEDNISKTLAPSALEFPAQVTAELNAPGVAAPVVHIPLPGWVWNLDRRKQWQNALAHWRKIDDLVLLVELPPACEPESVLLAEKVPQLVWLSDSGKVTFKETRHHLETLRHAGCNLVGTVLNREPNSFFRNQLSRWFGIGLLMLSLGGSTAYGEVHNDYSNQDVSAPKTVLMARAVTQEITPTFEEEAAEDVGGATNRSFFVSNRSQRAAWQDKLTLGPGDVLNLGFFGETNLTKNDIAIGPDGRISYLQATDVVAAGLTVDELRATLDKELSKYYRSPRSIVTPVQFRSKKYYVLGKVMSKGVFTLDRPVTVVEAVANAKGLETGMLNRNSVDLADLQRSFLLRKGERLKIDFEKLFQHGDLSQNVPIEPDDFLYFPPMVLHEVYVVGEVMSPGVMSYTANATLIKAVADRGGFSNRAYKSRVLVVRGSLNRPETFVVNTHDIVDGKMADFPLQAKDIVYVSSRPFIKAEELLDLAATSFIQAAVTAWTGQKIGPFITKPFINGIYRNR